ncbi:hypothetical protein FHT29_005274 [Rhizobium sp. SG741]|nr:hypothetical protein [Rhizobium sp. SG741]
MFCGFQLEMIDVGPEELCVRHGAPARHFFCCTVIPAPI